MYFFLHLPVDVGTWGTFNLLAVQSTEWYHQKERGENLLCKKQFGAPMSTSNGPTKRKIEEENISMCTIAVIVENRARETTVAYITQNIHMVEICSLVDGPSYCETTDLLTTLGPDQMLIHSSATESLLTRKIRACCTDHPRLRGAEMQTVSRAYFDQGHA